MERDRESLRTGETDPRDYYEEKEKEFLRNGKAELLDRLSDRTPGLSSEEMQMLAKFSDEDTGRPLTSLNLLIG